MKKKRYQFHAGVNIRSVKRWITPLQLIVLALIIIVILRAYHFLPSVYYLHDEWRALSDVFLYGVWTDIRNNSLIEIIFGKGRMLGSFLNSVFYLYAPYNTTPFIISFLIAHILNSYFLYLLVIKETNSTFWAISSALLFATSSRYEQALTWIGAGNQTLYSALFSLISIMFLLKADRSKIYFTISLLFACIGFLFKDASAYVFLLIFIYSIYYLIKRNNNFHFKLFSLVSLSTVGLICIFIISKIYSSKVANTDGFGIVYILTKGVFNTVYYPIVSLSQFLIPFRFMERLGYGFLQFNYNFMFNDENRESIVHFILADFISVIGSILLLLVGYLLLRKRSINKRLVYISLFWFVATLIPISFRLINRYDSYINSLYMYYGGMPFWILIGGMITAIHQYIQVRPYKKIMTMFLIISFTFFIWKQIDITNREVRAEAIRGSDMKKFTQELMKISSTLPEKPVILLESNKNYIREYNRTPFLLGDGFVLSVLLYPTGKIPDKVIANRLFETFGEHGYIEENDKGYGFYTDINKLIVDLQNGLFLKEQLVYWYYDGYIHKLENKTAELKFKI